MSARPNTHSHFNRRRFVGLAGVGLVSGCGRGDGNSGTGELDKVWGSRGIFDGQFQKPRAIAIDDRDQLYIVDMTGRIQVFDPDGQHLRSWRTPEIKHGKPSGLSFDNEGNLLVADTHYYRVLFYEDHGKQLVRRTIGGEHGSQPGQFSFVTDAVQDSHGNYYIAQYHEHDRIQKYSRDGKFLFKWGRQGSRPGEFNRPQNLAIDDKDRLWIADSCNHRVQVFDATGKGAKLITQWGKAGRELGQLKYPYDILLDGEGHVYLCEFGNHRVQKFTLDGTWVGSWGKAGRGDGELHNPWAFCRDSRGRLHVLDSMNHRVQRVYL